MVYFVATIFFDKDKGDEYSEYTEKVVPIVEKYNGRYLIRSEKITPLGTDWKPNRVIIIEFDTVEQVDKEYRHYNEAEKLTMIFKQADILQYAKNPLAVKSIDACRKYLLQLK